MTLLPPLVEQYLRKSEQYVSENGHAVLEPGGHVVHVLTDEKLSDALDSARPAFANMQLRQLYRDQWHGL